MGKLRRLQEAVSRSKAGGAEGGTRVLKPRSSEEGSQGKRAGHVCPLRLTWAREGAAAAMVAVLSEPPAFPSPTSRRVLFELRCHMDVLTSFLCLRL